MGSWLLSVAGIVIIGALVEVLLTDSPMSKFIRGIFGFFVLLVIAQPLPNLLKNGVEAVGGSIELDTQLLQTINTQTASAFQTNTQNALEIAGFENIIVTIDYDKSAASFKIDRVFVNAFGVVLTRQIAGIDIEKEVTKIVCTVCNIDNGRVVYVG